MDQREERITQLYVDHQEEHMTQLYEKALAAMRRYSSCEEYLSAEPGTRKPINLTGLSSYIRTLQRKINEYDCCIDDVERAKAGTEILYWCRGVAQYDCVEEDKR